jgi:hypothetical protein
VSVALQNLPNTTIDNLPRMADFALWVTAAEQPLGLDAGEFMAAYAQNRDAGHELALEASPVGKPLLDFLSRINGGKWMGTATELLGELNQMTPPERSRTRGWPQSSRALSGCLRRLAPNLRAVGVEFAQDRTSNRRLISLERVSDSSVTSVTNVTTSEKQAVYAGQCDASVTQNIVGMTQSISGVTHENPENVADDANDDTSRSFTSRPFAGVSQKENLLPCPHDDVEESLTFDGYVNRHCRKCNENLPCRRAEPELF